MTYSTITGERAKSAQRSLWNGTTPKSKWQESSWGKRITAVAAFAAPIVITVATAVIRKKGTNALLRKFKAGGKK